MNILIFRNDGIGDLIITTTLIERILKHNIAAKITLICSNRNIEYAKILYQTGKLTNYYNIDEYKYPISKLIGLYLLLQSSFFEYTFVLRSSSLNIIISKIIRSGIVSGIVPLNSTKKLKNRYKPFKILINLFYSYHEIIDCRNNYSLSKNIHMIEHYDRLLTKIPKFQIDNNSTHSFSVPKLIKDKKTASIDNFLSKFEIKNFLIFHFDEKWDLTSYDSNKIIKLISSISKEYNGPILITDGLTKNIFDETIKNHLRFEKIERSKNDIQLEQSKKKEDIFYLTSLDVKSLFYLISLSQIIIEPHGALTHIGSIYNKKIIDLVNQEKKNQLLKWRPISEYGIQVDIEDIDSICKLINELKFKS